MLTPLTNQKSRSIALALIALSGILFAQRIKSETASPDLESPKATLIVKVTGLRNNRGIVRLGLFNSEETFSKRGMTYRTANVRPAQKEAIAKFSDIPHGYYGISLYHDENEDDRHNRGLILIGMEKFGFSNNVKPGLGPPPFEKVKFAVYSETKTITIKAQ